MTEAGGEHAVRRVILCYDGSPGALDALDFTASVLRGARVIVVSVWRRVTEEMLSSGPAPLVGGTAEANEEALRAASEAARAGEERARAQGLDAQALVLETSAPLWKAIEELAHAEDAMLIVCGTGRSGIKTVLPGDLASALVQHASRAVLVVPSGKAAAERRQEVENDDDRPRLGI